MGRRILQGRNAPTHRPDLHRAGETIPQKNRSSRPGFEIFILLLVGASSISLVSAESGENSLIPLRLLFPPNPLRWASAGALFSLTTIACRHLHLASDKKQHTVKVRLQHLRHKRRNVRFKGLRRVHTPPQPLTAHTAAYTAKHGAFRTGVVSLPSERFARFGNPVGPGVRTAYFAAF